MSDRRSQLTSHDVPQADRVERVLDLAVALANDDEPTAEALGVEERDMRYYAHAAYVLGLLDREGTPTPIGEALTALHPDRYLARLALAFAESRVGRRWVAWAGARHIGDVDPDSAEDFLREASDLAESTARRRAAALRAWQRSLGPHLPEAFRPTEPSERPPPLITAVGELSPAASDDGKPVIPDLPARGVQLFWRVARDLDPEELPALKDRVRYHLDEFHVAAKKNELLPVDLAEQLADAIDRLLDHAAEAAPEERALAVGAARYFVSDQDARPDLESVLGLDDDMALFNWVARRLGRDDLALAP